MNNLYELIKNLKEEKEVLREEGMRLRYNAVRDPKSYNKVAGRYRKVEEVLNNIEYNCNINYNGVAEIISEQTGLEHRFKIFRELKTKDKESYYTNRFVICYINNTNKYFKVPLDENLAICLQQEEYEKMLKHLKITNSVILSRSEELNSQVVVAPIWLVTNINFIKYITNDKMYSNVVSNSFEDIFKPMLKNSLQKITINSLNQSQETEVN